MTSIRVLVVDDHAILRDGIRSLLDRQQDVEVVGEAASGLEALERAAQLNPDIVLMDLAMPDMDGLEATRRLHEQFPEMKIVILTQHDNREFVGPVLEAGASGYVLKRSGGRELVAALLQVHESGLYLEPGVTREVLNHFSATSRGREEPGAARLTDRELQVLEMVVAGKSNKEIAQELVISPKTASVHRTNIMSKLGVHNSAELVRYAMEKNLLGRPPARAPWDAGA